MANRTPCGKIFRLCTNANSIYILCYDGGGCVCVCAVYTYFGNKRGNDVLNFNLYMYDIPMYTAVTCEKQITRNWPTSVGIKNASINCRSVEKVFNFFFSRPADDWFIFSPRPDVWIKSYRTGCPAGICTTRAAGNFFPNTFFETFFTYDLIQYQ